MLGEIMAKKNMLQTPKSKIISMLRRSFMYSRESNAVKKRDKKICTLCGSAEHLRVHHLFEHHLDEAIKILQEHFYCSNENLYKLTTLCKSCHARVHKNDKIRFKDKLENKEFDFK